MGTEIHLIFSNISLTALHIVKLNNPQMGTEMLIQQ